MERITISNYVIRTTFVLTVIFGFSSRVCSQNVQIEGKVVDALSRKALNEASILILQSKDSFLIEMTRSNEDGFFEFENIPWGVYTLRITYPEYVDYIEPFQIDSLSTNIDFKTLGIINKTVLLNEVVLSANKSAVRIKKDTIEYDANSFQVPPNANVEDLLRELPGIQVDGNGNITVSGKTISKVLVDGEEFFGDDPILVTRNLKADMVDKVQLYDKTSEQAAFTGIDDGKKTKTIDLKLKEEKKNGFFGKIELGGATKGFYQNQVMLNSFKGKRKFATYFILGNTGLIGLDKRAQKSYAGGDSNPIENDLDKWNGTYEGKGIPKSMTGGLHYDNKWDKDKQFININYKLGGLDVIGEENTKTQNNLPDNVYYTVSSQQTRKKMLRQGLNGVYEVNLDSTSTLKMSVEGSLLNKTVDEENDSETNREDGYILNNSIRNTSVDESVKAVNTDILWQKKFKTERRTFSLHLNTTVSNNNSNGSFYTINNYFDEAGVSNGTEIIDQYKTSDNKSGIYSLKAIYTEPMGKYGALAANYKVIKNNADAELLTYNKNKDGIYNNLDSLYSNSYKFNQFLNQGGLAYIYSKDKIRFQVGNDISLDEFNQRNLFDNSILKRSFTNWYPNAKFTYDFSELESISLNYSGNTIEPSIEQIQPVTNNNDPLNVFVGNPNLKPFFSNSFSVSYSAFKDKNSSYLGISGNFFSATGPITTSVQTDSLSGKNSYSYVNLKGEKSANYSGNVFYSTKTNIWNLDFGVNADFNEARNMNVSDDEINTSNSSIYQMTIILSKQKQDSYYVGVRFGPSYNTNKSSLQPSIDNNSWGYLISPTIKLTLPFGLLVRSEGTYDWQGKTQTFTDDFHRFIWNASVEKKVLKNDDFLFRFSAHDILNQNVGFDRTTINNFIHQNSYTTISQYFMISLVWDFNKNQ